MIQRFIELGEGYSDIYELIELTKRNQDRLSHMMALHSEVKGRKVTSLVVVMQPTKVGDFQALYICREGIPNPHHTPNKRFDLFQEVANDLHKVIIEITVKSSNEFGELALYYQYLIAILRLNHYIPALR
ncbi:MAG TPA: methylthioribose kinase [Pseudoneobacillus sp.]|nr:methylthioribose kinase [Pseudoneobacillus sp.]